ncbi:hypothetical protein WMY93_000895 [Mugilogobius chulae]|uniref:Macrophage-capping protein n=1 Tax=Mugilogobius chulae TaxID=88201 RepID=A0AAW0Q3U1_9GOBI
MAVVIVSLHWTGEWVSERLPWAENPMVQNWKKLTTHRSLLGHSLQLSKPESRMVCHKEFVNAGKQPGLLIWRIENLDLKPVPKGLHGSFYTGDAYLLLHTTSLPSHSIHMWIGDECSQDESGAALCSVLSSISHCKGGVASGFQHVVTNDANVKRLLHIKGRRVVRATEVDMTWNSFNKGDCFILDLGKDIYQWCGSECNRFERLKASEVAIDIRDNERNGRAKIHLVEDGDEAEAFTQVLGAKGSIAPATPDDEKVDVSNRKKGALYMISDASGSMKVSMVAQSSPFKQAMLSAEECYILDNGVDRNIFVWKGPKANTSERKAAMSAGQKFIKDKGYSNKTQIQVLPAGAETTLFKQFFSDWKDKDQTTGPSKGYAIGRIAKISQEPFDASSLHSNKAMAAHHGMVDDGKGKVKIWRVEDGASVEVDPAHYGHFYGGDCYLILYSYRLGGREQHIIYTWQGLKCTQDELAASAFLTVRLDDSMGGAPVQVKACASLLNTNDVFVAKSPSALFVWKGAGASDEEMNAAKHVVGFLGGSPASVSEGREPADFWSALGGKKEYQTSKALRNVVTPPRLFGCSNKTGRLIVEEVPGDFTQSDLATDDVMLLDTGDQIFLWVGKDANAEERNGAPKIAKEYVDSDPSGRKGIPITSIKQGAEPPTFTGWFQAWDAHMWDSDPLDRIRARF